MAKMYVTFDYRTFEIAETGDYRKCMAMVGDCRHFIVRERGDYEEGLSLRPPVSLRDHFAGQALAGICARIPVDPRVGAQAAYRMADAMLAERGR